MVGALGSTGTELAGSVGLSEELVSPSPVTDNSAAPLPSGSGLQGLAATDKVVSMEDLKNIGDPSNLDETFNDLMANKSPEEVFAGMLYLYGPRLEMLTRRISNKGLRKIIKAIAEYPLNLKPYKILDEHQKEVYNILDRMVMAKSMMMLSSMVKNIEEAKAAESNSVSVNVSADPEGGSVTAQPVEDSSVLNNSEVRGSSNGEVQS